MKKENCQKRQFSIKYRKMKFTNAVLVFTLVSCIYVPLIETTILIGPQYFLLDIHVDNTPVSVGAYTIVIRGYHLITVAEPFITISLPKIRVYPLDEEDRRRAAGTAISVREILFHPRYHQNKRLYNMALMMLYEDFITVMPRQLLLSKPHKIYKECFWHSVTVDFEIETLRVEDLDYEDCRDEFESKESVNIIEHNMMCAKYKRDMCTKEFGFVIVCDAKYLVGMGLDGDTACGKTRPFIAYDVAKFRDWLSIFRGNSSMNSTSTTTYQNLGSVTIYNIIISNAVILYLY